MTEATVVLCLMESAQRTAHLLEALLLCLLTYYVAYRSLLADIESGSWILLVQTPVGIGRLLLGRLCGIAAVSLACHSVLGLACDGFLPLLAFRPGRAALWHAAAWAMAVGYVPEAFFLARARSRGRRPYLIFQMIQGGRFLGALLAFDLGAPRHSKAAPWVFDAPIAALSQLHPLAPHDLGLVAPLAMLVTWQVLTGVAIFWAFCTRRYQG